MHLPSRLLWASPDVERGAKRRICVPPPPMVESGACSSVHLLASLEASAMYQFARRFCILPALILAASVCHRVQAQDLFVDFNSTTQDNGPHNNVGYQAYDAGHEVIEDFITQNFSAFGTTIGITPAWPNSTANTVQQMIDRGAGNDANWADADLDLVTDFLGIDTRTGNGGNGDWDGTNGTPTYMTLTLSGLPASPNQYEWKSYHHDTEHVHGDFAVWLSTDSGATFTQL
ncbi:MAG: hypothetical protein AAF961_04540, partial [Planctomycetota bacterium]